MSALMWETIAANKRRSAWLIFILALLLAGMGAAIGLLMGGSTQTALYGLFIGIVVWGVMLLVNMMGGESVLLASANAREVAHADAPQLYNIVEEMRISAALPAMPRVFIIDTPVPNAFAVGLKPERACVAVTSGLLERLSRDELQGVIAHELGHISNRDTLFMTLAGVTLGAIVLLADLGLRMMFWGGGRRRSSNNKNAGAAMAIMMIIALVLAILAPIIARLLYFACSRQREYLADASAAQFTRYPAGLANALRKIALQQDPKKIPVNRVVAPMYAVNPLAAAGSASIFGTHPPTEERIRRLMDMQGGAPAPSASPSV
ncbi:MAG: M48 family metallopeptidase [Kiritimatiellae bacterium]|nr:M48 family metallopeptidase [Kiritimatiellia bacterium]MDD4341657.1 M48 family metallopeptidase [Kiritimatiellia bacterium]